MSRSRSCSPLALLARSPSTSLARREVLSPRGDSLGPGIRKGIVQLEGEDSESEMLTVVLVPQVEPLAPVVHGPCVAVVEWGNGSGTAIAEVDFAKGSVIQVAGSYLLVDGRNDGAVPEDGTADPEATAPTIDPDPGDQAVVVIVSGYGSRPLGPATRTFYAGDLAPGAERSFPVPNFAKSVVVTRRPTATTSIEVEIGDLPEPPLGAREGPFLFAGVPAARLDLYPFAGGVAIRNVGRTAVQKFQVVFELTL